MYKKNWWKVLGVAITLYVIVAGLLIPLNPGIVSVSNNAMKAGATSEVTIKAYNVHYTQRPESIRAWIKLDGDATLAASEIEVLDDVSLSIRFDVPDFLPIDRKIVDGVLVIDHEVSGMALLPSAFFIKQDSVDIGRGSALWVDEIDQVHSAPGIRFPYRNILVETIRNTYFHVAIWFAMFILLITSVVYSIKYTRKPNPHSDIIASSLVQMGIVFGLIGVATGALWARSTWGTYWTNDTKLNMTAVSLLIYMAYIVLRQAIPEDQQRARVSAIYNVFAFAAMIPLLFVVPRLNDSLHPGSGGNPALGGEDLDYTMRMVFYPAIIGYTLIGLWITELLIRVKVLKRKLDYGVEEE